MKELLPRNVLFVWLLVATCFFLLIPLLAMQFSSDVHWTAFDFMVMGSLIVSAGSLLILLSQKLSKRKFQVSAIFVLLGFLYIWAELAVGIFSFGS